MANMSKQVLSVDIHSDFIVTAQQKLAEVNISNVILENKNALTELDKNQKYDAIAVTASVPEYMPLFEQLLKPGGRLFIVVGSDECAHAMKVECTLDEHFVRTSMFETALAPLIGLEEKSEFIF